MAKFYLFPSGAVSSTDLSPSGAPTIWEALDDALGVNDSAEVSGSSVARGDFRVEVTNPPTTPYVVNWVKVHSFFGSDTSTTLPARSTRIIVASGATTVYGSIVTVPRDGGLFTEYTHLLTLDPATGLPWTPASVNAMRIGMDEFLVPENDAWPTGLSYIRYQKTYVEVDATAIGAKTEQTREVGSLTLLHSHRGRVLLDIVGGPEFLDVELGSIVSVWHRTFVDPVTGVIRPQAKWARRPYELLESTPRVAAEMVDGDAVLTIRVEMLLRDLRDGIQLVTDWDTMTAQGSASPFGSGVARLTAGGVRTYSRTGNAYVESPGDGKITLVEGDFEKFDAAGQVIERGSTNYILNNAFTNGFTSWTAVNATLDTADTLWTTSATPNSVKFANGVSGVAPSLAGVTGSLSGIHSFSVTHKDNTGAALSVSIVRNVDGLYWRASDSTWQVAATYTVLAIRATVFRDVIEAVDLGATAGTVTVTILGVTTANQTWNIYDVQFENSPYTTTRIRTTTAPVTRSTENLRIVSASAAAAAWPTAGVTGYVEFTPFWFNALVGPTLHLLALDYDANNAYYLQWVGGGTNRYELVVKVAGVSYIAYKAHTNARGTKVRVAWRIVSAEGDLGLAPHTLSIWVNDVQGTDVVGVAMSAPVYPATMYIGGKDATTGHCGGTLGARKITPLICSATEIARKLR